MPIDPATLSPADRYKLLIGVVVPRPIAFVSTVSPDGALNLAPFSFFAAVGADPMTLLFCPANKPDGTEKDSLRNALDSPQGGTGCFVVNLASEPYAREMAACAEPLPHGESEFDLAGLTPTPSVRVAAPRLAESPVSFECRTRQVLRLNPGVPGGANIVLGDVVMVHARDGVLNDRMHADMDALRPVARLGGSGYCRVPADARFEMPMGRAALSHPGSSAQ